MKPTYLTISLALVIAPSACVHHSTTPVAVQRPAAPPDLTGAQDSELQRHLAQNVMMRGIFSLRGKLGPLILVAGRPIYLESRGRFSWGDAYAGMEDKEVRVTGTLRFAHYPKPPSGALPEGRASDHFYFEAETVRVELTKEQK